MEQNRGGNIYSKLRKDSSLKLGAVLAILAVIASAMAVLFVIHAESDNSSATVIERGWCGQEAYYYYYSDGTLQIYGSGEMYDYSDSVHAPWSDYCGKITKIVIGDNITKLGQSAFVGTHVKKLTIPIGLNSVTSDQYPAFAGCSNINEVVFTYGTDGIGFDYALTEGTDAWYQNTPWYQSRDVLEDIGFVNGVKTVGADSLRELKVEYLTLPGSMMALGEHCFYNCTDLNELILPISLNTVGSDEGCAFEGCCNIRTVSFSYGPNGTGFNYASEKGGNAWYQLTPWYQSRGLLKDISFADGIKSIGSYAFRELSITSVTIPESMTGLGSGCFFGCTSLTDLTLPISLNPYGDASFPAFLSCTAIQNFTFTRGSGTPFNYSDAAGTHCQSLAPWNMNISVAKRIIISDDITDLGSYMFVGCNIRELTLPISAKCVESSAFYDRGLTCYDSLETITVTKGTGTSYDYNLNSCRYSPWSCAPNLRMLTIEDGITHIGDYAFYACKTEEMVLPDTLGTLGAYPFADCSIRDLTLPISLNATWIDGIPAFQNVTGIVKVTFTPGTGYGYDYSTGKGCNCFYQLTPWYQSRSSLSEVVFEDGIRTVGNNAFRELNITSLMIPDTVESLGTYAFYQCSKLAELTIPITLNSVASNPFPAFGDCHAFRIIVLTPGADGIGVDYSTDPESGFYYQLTPWYQSRLVTDIVFMDGIRTLGADSFRELNITSLVIPRSVEYLSAHTFYRCTNLTTLTIPMGLNSVASDSNPAFDQCLGIEFMQFIVGEGNYAFDYTLTPGCDCCCQFTPQYQCRNTMKEIWIEDGFKRIGTHTFEGYKFYDQNSQLLMPEAVYLNGHRFAGENGIMYLEDQGMSQTADNEVIADQDPVSEEVSFTEILSGSELQDTGDIQNGQAAIKSGDSGSKDPITPNKPDIPRKSDETSFTDLLSDSELQDTGDIQNGQAAIKSGDSGSKDPITPNKPDIPRKSDKTDTEAVTFTAN